MAGIVVVQDCIQNTLTRMGTNQHSFAINSFATLNDLAIARVFLWPRIRILKLLTISLAADNGQDGEFQIHVFDVLSDVLGDFARARRLEELKLEVIGFRLDALCFLSEELSNCKFTCLKRFESESLPHGLLYPFLSINTSLKTLNIGDVACEGHCPLILPDMHLLDNLRSAAICSKSIMPGKPIHHARIMDTIRSRDNPASFSGVMQTLRSLAPATALTRLEITFASTDMDILKTIAHVAPRLVHLGLIEIQDPADTKLSARRPWNHAREWSKSLQVLEDLEGFKLMTSRFKMPANPLTDVWYPHPRNPFKIPLGIHIWHHNPRLLVNVRYGWAWDEVIMDYAYTAVLLPMGIPAH